MELFQGYIGGFGILEILKDGSHPWYGMDLGGYFQKNWFGGVQHTS